VKLFGTVKKREIAKPLQFLALIGVDEIDDAILKLFKRGKTYNKLHCIVLRGM
jgi:hypothetical protein